MRVSDPGLQPQRTALAWVRTALAVAANGILVLRAGVMAGSQQLACAGAVTLVLAAGLMLVARSRGRQLGAHPASFATPAPVLLTTSTVVFTACAGVWSMLG